jgi:hypothetical protein
LGHRLFADLSLWLCSESSGSAEHKRWRLSPRYEVAIVKGDGPDKLQFITPQKSEAVRLFKTGVKLPEDICKEEFCLTWAANKMTQERWEPLSLDATRIVFRRQLIR